MDKTKKVQEKTSAIGFQNVLFLFCILFVAMIVVRNAWMSDDAFITLRSIDNWVNGYGLTWNVSERVQTFTHPLWLFVLSFPYFLTREPFYTSLFVNIAISLAVVILILNTVKHSSEKVIILTLILGLSKSFIDFSTSGLENALSHLIVLLFFFQFMRSFSALDEKQFTKLVLISAFGMTNRHDLALIFLPVLVWGVIQTWKTVTAAHPDRDAAVYPVGAFFVDLLRLSLSEYRVCQAQHRHRAEAINDPGNFLLHRFIKE